MAQLSLLNEPGPEGLSYWPELVDSGEEAALAQRIGELPFAPFQFHGFEGKRRTVSFGWHYAFDGSGLHRTDPVPDFLLPARARAAEMAGLEPDAFEHALLIEYEPGAGIGWHRDRPVFGEVVGISLLALARMRFRRKQGEKWQRVSMIAEPRSAYFLTGAARSEWEHSIPPVEELRYSITFRTLRQEKERRQPK